MRSNIITYTVIFVSMFWSVNANAQNGWVRNAKGLYAQMTASTFGTSDYYSVNGTLFDAGSTFQSQGLLFYGEYGLSNRFTAVIDVPVIMSNSFSTTETVNGVGNLKLGVKYGLLKTLPISIQVDAEIPTDDGINLATSKEPNSLGFFEQANLPTSDGEYNFWTTVAGSHSFSNNKTFGTLFISANWRTESFNHQFQSGIELGHLFFEKLYVIGKLKIQEKLTDKEHTSGSIFYGEGTTFTTYGLTSMYKLNDKWRIVAGASDFSGFISERKNIYDGFTYNLGVALELE